MPSQIVKWINYVWIKFKVYLLHYAPIGYFMIIWYIGKHTGKYCTRRYIFMDNTVKYFSNN